MDSLKEKEGKDQIKSTDKLNNLKNDYFLTKVFNSLETKKSLNIIKYNKNIKKRLDIDIKNYKEYSEKYSSIELEIKPVDNSFGKFINIIDEDKKYFHIYFNNNEDEINSNCINENEQIKLIKIIIDYPIKSFENLFIDCHCIEFINFKKFVRNNIIDMSYMFDGCLSLKELDLNNFNTINVTNMNHMFSRCSLLKELNLNNFNTNNVTDMKYMFYECSSLKKLNLNNFNTDNVTDMALMFSGCSSLKELELNNFNTNNVTNMAIMFSGCSSLEKLNLNNFKTNNVSNMNYMFDKCSSLKELNIDNFNTDNVIYIDKMFRGCSNELITKIKTKYKNIKEKAFENENNNELKVNNY